MKTGSQSGINNSILVTSYEYIQVPFRKFHPVLFFPHYRFFYDKLDGTPEVHKLSIN